MPLVVELHSQQPQESGVACPDLNLRDRERSRASAEANSSTSTRGRSGDPEHAALHQIAGRSHSRVNAASRLTIFAQSELQ
jgi:hypothetical protein